jgi:hypothetical protein
MSTALPSVVQRAGFVRAPPMVKYKRFISFADDTTTTMKVAKNKTAYAGELLKDMLVTFTLRVELWGYGTILGLSLIASSVVVHGIVCDSCDSLACTGWLLIPVISSPTALCP